MGTISKRPRKDGTVAYMAQIVVKRDGKTVHRENRTFDRRPAAAAWLKAREAELAEPGALSGLSAKPRAATLSDAIDRYVSESRKEIGKTKAQVLDSIKRESVADIACDRITSVDIVDFAKGLSARMKPQTVANYLSHLAAVFSIARPAWGYDLDKKAMDDAMAVTRRLGLASKSEERDRRPTLEELDKLMAHFVKRKAYRQSSTPMAPITAFAIFSTRRQEEITRILWSDLDADGSRVLVRDMKHPGDKKGNHVWTELPPEALRVIRAMPKVADEIFPYGTDAISAAFTRSCQLLEIENLHFHDLRHDGVSRLFEMGRGIPQVAAVSGHRAWASLKRYTHLRQTGDKYADWRWLDEIAPTSTGAAVAPT
ncbi:MAG: tyrosine-type recombinase/integrase [Hyphomicrobiales bacterium]|nr:tyrosine-type recombinase/integrase [Hyphomicrobiales bacterium]